MTIDTDPISETISSYEDKFDEYIKNTDKLSYFPDLPAMLDKFQSALTGQLVLDSAFGSGRDTLYLQEKGCKVIGIELTPAFITYLHHQSSNSICRMDMRHMGFAPNSFDGIWCCAAFLHIPREEAFSTLSEYSRILRHNGILYFDLKEGIGDEWKYEGNVNDARRYFTYYSLDEITELVEMAGLKIIFSRTQDHAKKNQGAAKPSWLNLLCKKMN